MSPEIRKPLARCNPAPSLSRTLSPYERTKHNVQLPQGRFPSCLRKTDLTRNGNRRVAFEIIVMLPSVAVCCRLLSSGVDCCRLLSSVVVCCRLLSCVVVCCRLLLSLSSVVVRSRLSSSVVVCCRLLLSVVVCCCLLSSVVVCRRLLFVYV